MGSANVSLSSRLVSIEELRQTLGPELFEFCGINSKDLIGTEKNIPLNDIIRKVSNKTDIFLSHDWGIDNINHRKVSAINDALKKKGLKTWFDAEKMQGDIKSDMSTGIDNSRIVLIFITERYERKLIGNDPEDSCRLEFGYAARRKTSTNMIPVLMEASMRDTRQWTGQLGLVLGGSLYVDFSEMALEGGKSIDIWIDVLMSRILQTIGEPINALTEKLLAKLNLAPEMQIDSTINLSQLDESSRSLNFMFPLDAVEEFSQSEKHTSDHERILHETWTAFQAFDWARSPKGYIVDANQSILVGLGEYEQSKDGSADQLLVIKHFDSTRPGNYAKRDSWGHVPAVWGIAFSTKEMRQLTQSVVQNVDRSGTLIHREPELDRDATEEEWKDQPWFSETHWLVENGKLTGLKLLVKCSQDVVPRSQLIRFKSRGRIFDLVEVKEDVLPPTRSLSVLEIPSPPPSLTAPSLVNSEETEKSSDEFYGKVGAVIQEGGFDDVVVKSDWGDLAAEHYEERDKLIQSLKSTFLSISNSSNAAIQVNVSLSHQNDNGEWLAAEGILFHQWDWAEEGAWPRDRDLCANFSPLSNPIKVPAQSSLRLRIEGHWAKEISTGVFAIQGEYSRRVHSSFPSPLVARLLFDAADSTKAERKCVDLIYRNPPLGDSWLSFDQAVSSCKAGDGFGVDFQADLWLCVENPLNLQKAIICVTSAKTTPQEWYFRVQSDSRQVGQTYYVAGPSYFDRLAFKASLSTDYDRPVEVDIGLASAPHCRLLGLVDYQTRSIYGLHGVIDIRDNNNNPLVHVEGYMKLDYNRLEK